MELEQSDSSLKSDKLTSVLPDDLDPDLYEYEMGINSNILGTGIGQAGALAYHGNLDAPAHQSLA